MEHDWYPEYTASEDDWSWRVLYETQSQNMFTTKRRTPPWTQVAGVNLETNCRQGTIELRRSPTGLFLDSVECELLKNTGVCSSDCEMWQPVSVREIIGRLSQVVKHYKED